MSERCKENITFTYAPIISTLLFHVLRTSILIWWVWSIIISAWLMSQKVGCEITAVQFCKWLIGVWKSEWETFKEVYYVRAKENDINSTSGMKQRQSERGKSFWEVYWTCTLHSWSHTWSYKLRFCTRFKPGKKSTKNQWARYTKWWWCFSKLPNFIKNGA